MKTNYPRMYCSSSHKLQLQDFGDNPTLLLSGLRILSLVVARQHPVQIGKGLRQTYCIECLSILPRNVKYLDDATTFGRSPGDPSAYTKRDYIAQFSGEITRKSLRVKFCNDGGHTSV